MSDKPHLSKTQLEMVAKCPAQYEHRYVLGKKRPPGVAAVIGSGSHKGAEVDLLHKMETGVLMEEEAVTEYAGDEVKRKWAEETPVRQDGDPDQGGAVDEAVFLSRVYHRELAPRISPVAVEQPRMLEIPGFKYDIMLIPDVEEADKIRDLKTKGKAPAATEAELSIQGAIETLEAKVRGRGELPFVLDILLRGKKKPLTQVSRPTANDHLALLGRVEQVTKLIDAGAFPPTQPGNWWCSKKWCGYYDECAWGARKRVSVGLIDPASLTSRLVQRRAA